MKTENATTDSQVPMDLTEALVRALTVGNNQDLPPQS